MTALKRVVYNTGFLYAKMVISMFIALYSTRIVLNALGVDDFGIFNIVGGVIAMLTFLNAAMATSTQRYLSYYIGANNRAKLNSVFKSSVILHLIIGIGIVILLEIASFFLFDGFLNIAQERIPAAKLVYQTMVISTFFTINAVPYDAIIVSNENLLFDAIIGIFESILKLAIAIALTFYLKDRLILYGILIAALIILIRIIKSIYCNRKFPESNLRNRSKFNFGLAKEMFSFASFNLFGTLCWIGSTQGIALILNIFFGTVINAAYGIAYQVNSQLYAFSSNMQRALDPQIVKNEGKGNRNQMLYLSEMASKYSFFLLAFFAIPLIIEMPTVLKLWLKTIPDNTIIFCRLLLVISLIKQLTIGSYMAIQATGKIRVYQPVTGAILLLNLPIAYIILKQGFPPSSVFVVMIIIEILSMNTNIYFWVKIAKLKLSNYFFHVFIPTLLPTSISLLIIWFIRFNIALKSDILNLLLIAVSWGLVYLLLIFILGMNKNDKIIIKNKLHEFIIFFKSQRLIP